MKDTPLIRKYIDTTVKKYCKQIGYVKPPKLLFTEAEANKDHSRDKIKPNKCLGISCHECNTLFVNIGKNKDRKEIENTIVHELTHLRFPIMNHEPHFYERIGMILMGKKYGKVKKK